MRRQQQIVEADDRQLVGHDPRHAVGGVEDADGDEVGRGDDRGRRFGQRQQGAERRLAAGQAVVDDLEVAVRDAPEALGHDLREGVLALPVVARQPPADEADPSVAEADEVVEARDDAGSLVDVDGRELERARPLPGRDDRHRRLAEVLEQTRLVLHVAEHHDGVGVAGLEDRRQRDPLVHPAMGVADDDVVAAGHRLHGQRLDDRREERIAEVAHDRADEHRRRAPQAPGVRVRAVTELPRGDEDAFAGVGRDRDPGRGVVEDARDRALGDTRGARDVAHRRDRPRSRPVGPCDGRRRRIARTVVRLYSHRCKRITAMRSNDFSFGIESVSDERDPRPGEGTGPRVRERDAGRVRRDPWAPCASTSC